MLRPPAAAAHPHRDRQDRAGRLPKGYPYLRVADELGAVFADSAFTALFPRRGQPALAPWLLTLATILQFAEGLSERQAADAVRVSRLEVRAGAGAKRRGLRRLRSCARFAVASPRARRRGCSSRPCWRGRARGNCSRRGVGSASTRRTCSPPSGRSIGSRWWGKRCTTRWTA